MSSSSSAAKDSSHRDRSHRRDDEVEDAARHARHRHVSRSSRREDGDSAGGRSHRHHHRNDEDRHRRHSHRSRSPPPRRKSETSGNGGHSSSRSHRHHRDNEHDEKDEVERERRRKGKDRESDRQRVYDDDGDDAPMVVEMYTDGMDVEGAVATIPTSESLDVRSYAAPSRDDHLGHLPKDSTTTTQVRRDDWMLSKDEEVDVLQAKESRGASSSDGGDDFLASLGGTYAQQRKRPPKPEKRNPDELHVSSREINKQFAEGKHLDEYDDPHTQKQAITPGAPGSQWRMMKLRRVYEAADDEGRAVEEVALERYGSMEAFNEARAERQVLDDRQRGRRGGSGEGGHRSGGAQSRSDTPKSSAPPSRPLSRQSSSFRKPGEESAPSTPGGGLLGSATRRATSIRQSGVSGDSVNAAAEGTAAKSTTPIPNVFTPPSVQARPDGAGTEQSHEPPLSATALNKLSAKVLRAEMLGSVDATELRRQLEREQERLKAVAQNDDATKLASGTSHVQVLPTLDAHGRLYDVGRSGSGGDTAEEGHNARKKIGKFETRDAKTGELLRYNADDDQHTLADLVREERFGAGSASQKNMDAQLAERIVSDRAFKDNVDYMDDNVERLGRRKMKSDAMKRMFAVQDFAKTKKALDTCRYCWQDDQPPRSTVISSGTRSYLAMPEAEALVEGHCLIIPMQHHLTMLEADDDTWEEVKNFMKCLMRMAAERQRSVLFYETVKTLKQQRHTCIEALPIEHDLFSQLPGYFRQSILDAGDEWSQNKRLIEFSGARPFRQSMVPNLPYFMVQWDHRGEKGYGHVIEEQDNGGEGDAEGDGFGLDDRVNGRSAQFPRWFAAEIIGNLLEYEPQRWRKPRRLSRDEQQRALDAFRASWSPHDWTKMLDEQQPIAT